MAAARLPALVFAVAMTAYGLLFLAAERERAVGALIVAGAAAVALAARFGLLARVRASIAANEGTFDATAIAGVLVVALWFHEEHFVLLMMRSEEHTSELQSLRHLVC